MTKKPEATAGKFRVTEYWNKLSETEKIIAECFSCEMVTFYQEKENNKIIVRRFTPCCCSH